MGLSSEKSPEEELVDELVGSGVLSSSNLREVLDDSDAMTELKSFVQDAWRNGASVSEIQKVYDDNLARLQKEKTESSLEHIGDETEISSSSKEKEENKSISITPSAIIATIVIICLAVGGIYSIFFMEYEYTSFNTFEIDGLSFNIPTDYELNTSSENEDAFFSQFFTVYTSSSKYDSVEREHYIFIEVYVYKNKSVQEVVSKLSSEGWEVNNATYGKYSGYLLERDFHEGGWFVFKKDGKTVSIYCERKAVKQNIEKIIT